MVTENFSLYYVSWLSFLPLISHARCCARAILHFFCLRLYSYLCSYLHSSSDFLFSYCLLFWPLTILSDLAVFPHAACLFTEVALLFHPSCFFFSSIAFFSIPPKDVLSQSSVAVTCKWDNQAMYQLSSERRFFSFAFCTRRLLAVGYYGSLRKPWAVVCGCVCVSVCL